MAIDTLASSDALLKDVYRGPIIEQINYKTYMLDMIERDSESIVAEGRRWLHPVHASGNQSTTGFSDGGTLPDPDTQEYLDAIDTVRYFAAGMEITDATIRQAKGGQGSFVNVLTENSKRIGKDMRKRINAIVFGDGKGTVAVLSSSPGGATTFTVVSTQYLRVGQKIDVRTISTGALENSGNVNLIITAINKSTKTVTVSAAVTATTGTAGVFIAGEYGLVMPGLQSISNTSRTLHGINSATAGNEFWNGHRRAASGAVAGEGLFELLADDIGEDGGNDIEWFLTSRGVRRRLADTYQSAKRFNDAKAVEIHGGYTAIFVNEIPVLKDDDVPKGWAFGGRKDAFKWFEVDPPGWLESKDGTVWHLANGAVAGTKKASWQAWFTWYAALGCLQPNSFGAIPDAEDDA